MKRSSRPFILFGSIASLCAVAAAHAGTIRDDVADSAYTALAALPEYAAVGKITTNTGLSSGTLIGDFWVLTAAHNLSFPYPTSAVFNIGGTDYTALEWIPHAGFNDDLSNGSDIGLVRLSAAVTGVTAAVRYTGSAELGETATIVGFGATGTGLTGDTLASGTKRAGQNVLDVLGSSAGISGFPLTDDYILADFDRPATPSESSYGDSTPLALEYSSAPGDSGGGVFIQVAGQTRLAGVVSFGVEGPNSAPDGDVDADYGDLMGFTRVSQFNAWIDDQTSAIYWGSAASGSFADTARWADGLAPGAAHIAVFKTAGTFTATLAADTANKRLRVRTGTVTLDLAGHTYTLANTGAERSILVGQVSGDSASLTFTGGTVTAVDASLGEASGATGSLRLTGAGTSLVLSGSLGVGGSPTAAVGTGSFTVDSSASAQVGGNMKISTGGTVNVIAVGGNLSVTASPTKSISRIFNNAGTVQVQAGTLSLTNGGTSTGSFAVSGLLRHGLAPEHNPNRPIERASTARSIKASTNS